MASGRWLRHQASHELMGHICMLDTLKKVVLSLSVIVLFALYALQKQTETPSTGDTAVVAQRATTAAPTLVVKPTNSSQPTAKAAPARTAIAVATATPQLAVSGAYRDGSYSGDASDANWGDVQVEVEISGGQITNVDFLEYPNHRNRSRSINERAMPILIQEAIQAQDANVDVISGATDTSEAFIESLDSALSQAKP